MIESIYGTAKPKKSTPLASYLKSTGTGIGPATVAKQPAQTLNLGALFKKLGPPPAPAAGQTPFAATKQQQQGWSYGFDPVLSKIQAANAGDLQQAEIDALKGKRDALTAFGSKELAAKILGAGDATVGAIDDDPEKSMSVLARIARANKSAVKQTEDDLNAGNLFYGGARGVALKNLETDRQTNVTDAEKALQQGLADIADALAGVKKKVNATGGTASPPGQVGPGVSGVPAAVVNAAPPPGVIPAIAQIAAAHPLDPTGPAAQKVASLGAGKGVCPAGYTWDGTACVKAGGTGGW